MSRSKTVLVVDDEEGMCETLKDVFEDEGFTVNMASNGAEALTLLRGMTVKPCIVILDLLMPVLDGNTVYRTMKADPTLAQVPIVISTSDPSRAPSGAMILKKPVSLAVLLDQVRRCC
jgi:CheY-like chemotaxis protein